MKPAPEVQGLAAHGHAWWALDLLDNRYAALHGFRVLAILSVVQYHVTWTFAEARVPMNRALADASLRVFFGMDLFFLLSGFLIGSILLRSLDTSGTLDLRRFYLRRIFRTFPPYYVVLAYLALITPMTEARLRHLPYEVLYATNFVSASSADVVMFWGWSLALEEQFYLVAPGLFFVLHKLKTDGARVALLVALALGALGRRLWMLYMMGPWTDFTLYSRLYFRTPTRYDAIVWGVLLAFIYQRWGEPIRAALRPPAARAAVAIPSLALLWVLSNTHMFGSEHTHLVRVLAWGTLSSAMYYGLVLLLLPGEGFLARFLAAPVFRRIGTLGYGVYLVHIPVCEVMLQPIARTLLARRVPMTVVWVASLVAVLAASLVLAYVLHLLIEKPALRLRQAIAG